MSRRNRNKQRPQGRPANSPEVTTLNVGTPIAALLAAIRRLPGSKIVTIGTAEKFRVYDVAEDGTVGDMPEHELLLRALLTRAMFEGGGMIIRQFLPTTFETKSANGKTVRMPHKRLYGVALGKGGFQATSAAQTKWAQNTDPVTHAALPEEEGVEYGELPPEPVGATN